MEVKATVDHLLLHPWPPAQVGDDPVTVLTDMRAGAHVLHLAAHADFSFAAAWHPQGHILATGGLSNKNAAASCPSDCAAP